MDTLRFERPSPMALHTRPPRRPWPGSWTRPCTLALITTALVAASAPALAQPSPASAQPAASVAASPLSSQVLDERFDDALQAYERNHWAQAFDAFRQLAELGHADAARLVMQMHCHGPQLYGQPFALTTVQRARLSRQARCS